MILAQTSSNDMEPLFVFKWCKPKNWYSNSVSAIENVEDLCPEIKGWNDEMAFGVMFKEIVSCNLGARTVRNVLPISWSFGDLD